MRKDSQALATGTHDACRSFCLSAGHLVAREVNCVFSVPADLSQSV